MRIAGRGRGRIEGNLMRLAVSVVSAPVLCRMLSLSLYRYLCPSIMDPNVSEMQSADRVGETSRILYFPRLFLFYVFSAMLEKIEVQFPRP